MIMRLSGCRLVGLAMRNRQSRPWIVSDELWLLIEPLLPEPAPKLIAPGGLERGGRLGSAALAAAGEAAVEEPAGPVEGGDRLLARPRGPTRPKSGPSPVDRAWPGSDTTSLSTARAYRSRCR